jgi:hypothetical protein
MLGQLQQQILMQARRQANIRFRNLLRHEIRGVIHERWKVGWTWQLNGCTDASDEAVDVVLAGLAVEPAGLAEAGVVYQVSYNAFHEVLTVDED